MDKPEVREVSCQSALNRVHGMRFRWSLNPYRGCQHGCAYCFARRTHAYFDLDLGTFSSVLLAKVNIVANLRRELSARGWRRETVAVGTATDPYQPIEARYRLTRGCLEALHDFRNPCTVVTKGPLVVRDADQLRALQATVCVSVPTVDPVIWRRMEPGTAHPLQRLRAVRHLADVGVHVGVLIAPLLPGLTTADPQIEAVIRAAAEHGARFVGGNLLYLKPGVKEHFFGVLQREYPRLVPVYAGLYPGAYAPPGYAEALRRRVAWMGRRHGIAGERPGTLQVRTAPQQLRIGV